MIIEPIAYQYFNQQASIITQDGSVFLYKAIDENFNNSNYNSDEFARATASNLNDLRINTFLKDISDPYIIFADGFNIPQFSKLKYDQHTVDYLNKHGLKIFLTELLVKYLGPRKYISKFDDLTVKLNEFNLHDVRFELDNKSLLEIKSLQLDSINDLIKNNNLTNVTVYTIEDNVNDIFSQIYPNIKFICKDLFLSFELPRFMEGHKPPELKQISKKFLCHNWRYSPSRHLLMSFLVNFDGNYSWYHKGNFDNLQKGIHFNLCDLSEIELINKGIENLNLVSPLNLDLDIKTTKTIQGQISDLLLIPERQIPQFISPNIYQDIFCVVVNECEFTEPTANISEKTLYAIKNKKPFILAAAPKSLNYLKKYGFKTFSEFWDEGYDLEINHQARLEKIFELIKHIDSFSIDQLRIINQELMPVIEYNYNRLIELTNSKDWPEFT